MSIRHLKTSLKILSIIGFAILPATGLAAEKVKVNAKYSLNVAGIKVGSVGLAAWLKPKSYSVSMTAFTTGMADWMLHFTIETRARGKYHGHKVDSTEYMTAYSNKRVTRKVVVKYPNTARATVNATPAYRPFHDTVPLHAKHMRNVVDPLGAMLLPFNKKYAANAQQQCNRSQPIFDGVTRYKLTMKPLKNTSKKYKNAILCKVTYTPIAGHRRSQADKTVIDNFSSAKVWLMPIEEARVLLPVRIEIPTKFGSFNIISSNINVGGEQLALK